MKIFDIVGYCDEYPDGRVLRNLTLKEWQGLTVSPETIEQYTFAEIMAHVLYQIKEDIDFFEEMEKDLVTSIGIDKLKLICEENVFKLPEQFV